MLLLDELVLEELLLVDELDVEEELLELLEEPVLLEDELLELDDDEEDEDDDDDDDELLVELPPLGTEHSLTPPATRPPKVASLQTKLPLNILYKN